jgi:hypothetical protein
MCPDPSPSQSNLSNVAQGHLCFLFFFFFFKKKKKLHCISYGKGKKNDFLKSWRHLGLVMIRPVLFQYMTVNFFPLSPHPFTPLSIPILPALDKSILLTFCDCESLGPWLPLCEEWEGSGCGLQENCVGHLEHVWLNLQSSSSKHQPAECWGLHRMPSPKVVGHGHCSGGSWLKGRQPQSDPWGDPQCHLRAKGEAGGEEHTARLRSMEIWNKILMLPQTWHVFNIIHEVYHPVLKILLLVTINF